MPDSLQPDRRYPPRRAHYGETQSRCRCCRLVFVFTETGEQTPEQRSTCLPCLEHVPTVDEPPAAVVDRLQEHMARWEAQTETLARRTAELRRTIDQRDTSLRGAGHKIDRMNDALVVATQILDDIAAEHEPRLSADRCACGHALPCATAAILKRRSYIQP